MTHVNVSNPTEIEYEAHATPITTFREVRERLEILAGSSSDKYLTGDVLQTMARLLEDGASLADISVETGIPAVTLDAATGEQKRVLRDELTKFGTWLGQRDATLKEVSADSFELPDDLVGCQNAKRNIVVSRQRGGLDTGVLADFLDQRYAVGDLTFKRTDFHTLVLIVQHPYRGDDLSYILYHAYDASPEGSGGRPASIMLKAIDIALTVHEDLQTYTKQLQDAISPPNPEKTREALEFIAWVNEARSRTTLMLMDQRTESGIKRMLENLNMFIAEAVTLSNMSPEDFVKTISDSQRRSIVDQYLPQDPEHSRKVLEAEAREWLRSHNLARQAPNLLTHVMWALEQGEISLLESCLQARVDGDVKWDESLLAAQLATQ